MTQRILTMAEALSIQRALNANGAQLDADGHFGPMTQAALMKFQTDHGLTADGNPSVETTTALGIPPIYTDPPPKPKGLNIVQAGIADYVLNFLTSKIAWAAAAMVALAVTWINTRFGFNVPPDVQNTVTALLVSGFGALIMLLRTFFSAPKVVTKAPLIVTK